MSLILKIQDGVYNKFVLVSEEKIEKIKISNSDTTFQPNVMPGAKVYIPTNALRQDRIVSFQVRLLLLSLFGHRYYNIVFIRNPLTVLRHDVTESIKLF